MPAPVTRWMGTTPARLRRGILDDRSVLMRLRRGTVAVSLLGIGAMAATTLLQTGILRRLPDPPIRGFDTRKVNTSDEAFSYGGPDSPINILAHAVNLVLPSTGGPTGRASSPGCRSSPSRRRCRRRRSRRGTCSPDAEGGPRVVPLLHPRRADPFRHDGPGPARGSARRAASAERARRPGGRADAGAPRASSPPRAMPASRASPRAARRPRQGRNG